MPTRSGGLASAEPPTVEFVGRHGGLPASRRRGIRRTGDRPEAASGGFTPLCPTSPQRGGCPGSRTELDTRRTFYRFHPRLRRSHLDAILALRREERRKDRGASHPPLQEIYAHVLDALRFWFELVPQDRVAEALKFELPARELTDGQRRQATDERSTASFGTSSLRSEQRTSHAPSRSAFPARRTARPSRDRSGSGTISGIWSRRSSSIAASSTRSTGRWTSSLRSRRSPSGTHRRSRECTSPEALRRLPSDAHGGPGRAAVGADAGPAPDETAVGPEVYLSGAEGTGPSASAKSMRERPTS